MSTSQRAVMLCGWGVKAGMTCLQVKLCDAISERFRKCTWYLSALYKCPGILPLTHRQRIADSRQADASSEGVETCLQFDS